MKMMRLCDNGVNMPTAKRRNFNYHKLTSFGNEEANQLVFVLRIDTYRGFPSFAFFLFLGLCFCIACCGAVRGGCIRCLVAAVSTALLVFIALVGRG